MLRRRPTRIEIEQSDIDELDLIRKSARERLEAASQSLEDSSHDKTHASTPSSSRNNTDPLATPIADRDVRNKTVRNASVAERLGLPPERT